MNMIESRKARAGQGGFTLIELLVVIAILAVLGGAAIIGIGAMKDNAKKAACNTDLNTVEVAAEAFKLDEANSNAYPATIAAMTGATNYLKKNISDTDFPTYASGTVNGSVKDGAAGGKYTGITISGGKCTI